ncbi:MAG: sigma-70 family RNA polymerase sigma factor [Clostridia bacterium]|nr:sigma-70 family RNA polymerase sigma factor [Clostridia bacterium]
MDAVTGPDRIEERLEQMVSLYQLPLLRLCYAYLHDEELARDAVQDTFLKAYRNIDNFREQASEKSWLTRIAINTCKDLRKSGWFRHVDRTVTPEMLPEAAAPAEPFDVNLSVEIMRLPIRLREAALLCWLQGLTQEEAAQALGISHQAVAGRLNRARKKLRAALEGSEDHDPA